MILNIMSAEDIVAYHKPLYEGEAYIISKLAEMIAERDALKDEDEAADLQQQVTDLEKEVRELENERDRLDDQLADALAVR